MRSPSRKILGLYQTENTSIDEKTIHQVYTLPRLGFYWMIAELDPKKNLAFGYANLNNDDFAEWGYIDINELKQNGAELDGSWKPSNFKDALQRMRKEKP